MKIIAIVILLAASYATASEGPPDTRPPPNRPPDHQPQPPGDVNVDVSVPVIVEVPVLVEGSPVTVDVPVDARSTNTTDIDFEDERQAPALGLSTPADSTGFGITTPLFGFMLNVPWTFGDRKIFQLCDRLVAFPEAWRSCICLTSGMKKLHGKDDEACLKSLGGGSSSNPKPPDDDTYTITGDAFGYTDDVFMAQLDDPEVDELRRMLDELMGKVAVMEASQAADKEREQVQQQRHAENSQQNQQQQQQQIDYGAVRRATARETLKQLEEKKPQ